MIGRKILLVEDHADSARVASILLQRAGYHVTVAMDCRTAMELAKAEPPDILLCDIGLPDGDGCDLLRTLLKSHRLMAIALTGHGMQNEVQRCRDAGFEEIVVKPFTVDRITAAIARVAENRSTIQPIQHQSQASPTLNL